VNADYRNDREQTLVDDIRDVITHPISGQRAAGDHDLMLYVSFSLPDDSLNLRVTYHHPRDGH